MIKRLLILCLFFPVTVLAQLTDDFEDGDITNWTQSTADRWAASDIDPLNGSYSLQHIFDNTVDDRDRISVELVTLDLNAGITKWRFRLMHGYDPSSSNNWGVFITSDANSTQMYPSGSANGYVVGVNYTGLTDTLKLWKITSGGASEILKTTVNWQQDVGTTEAPAIEVSRSATGVWEINYNLDGDFNSLANVGSGFEDSYLFTDYFGIYHEYTSGRDQKLWIDDISITGEIYVDNDPPVVDSLYVLSSNSLKLEFNEKVDSTIAVNPLNYLVNNGIGRPTSVSVDETGRLAELIFDNDIENGEFYEIEIKDVEDIEGNAMSLTTIEFHYYTPQPYDIVINEIMADPNPAVSLPEVEYLEIYNTSDFDINITGWTLKMGSTIKYFPSVIVKSNKYYIVCDEDDESEFSGFGNTITLSSLSLTNSGQTLIIQDESDDIISTVIYTEDWYQDEYKSEGGWSLEQIDPLNPCGEENNWIASESGTGGTPGQENSVYASNPDLDSPELLRITVLSENSILLFFNESLESGSVNQTGIYSVDHSIGNPTSVNLVAPDNKSTTLDFTNSFSASLVYTLEISGGILDCAGNEIADKNTARFAIPVDFEENDVVINEILFNPIPDGSDFIEIYNRSEKIFDIKDLRIATLDIETGEYSGIEHITDEGFLIFPGDYLVLTEDEGFIKEQYYTSNPDGFIDMDLPSMNDDNGIVLLLNKSLTIIDKLSYDEDMQFSLLATDEGVSLERINYNRSSVDKTNWHSASELAGFATPAYENSQFLDEEDITEEVNIDPEVFSPDNDGFEDVTNITFLLDEPGYVANIKIFDSKGRLVRYLANNQLMGIESVITWDGLDDKNQKALIGIYVVYIEIFDLDGNVKQFKKSVVVAARL
ncbi:MAG: lamin tail domain-containing protein [Bacteroidales bacterium]|nr:lamin tail domain-containing protein [Bacteroidales bacterium]